MIIVYVIAYPAIMISVIRMMILQLYQSTQAGYPKIDFFNAMLPFNVFDGFGNFG